MRPTGPLITLLQQLRQRAIQIRVLRGGEAAYLHLQLYTQHFGSYRVILFTKQNISMCAVHTLSAHVTRDALWPAGHWLRDVAGCAGARTARMWRRDWAEAHDEAAPSSSCFAPARSLAARAHRHACRPPDTAPPLCKPAGPAAVRPPNYPRKIITRTYNKISRTGFLRDVSDFNYLRIPDWTLLFFITF